MEGHTTKMKKRSFWLAGTLVAAGTVLMTALVGGVYLFSYLPWNTYDAIHFDPRWQPLNVRAMHFDSVQDFIQAESKLQKEAHSPLNAMDPIPHFLLGSLYHFSNQPELAIQSYQKSIDIIEADENPYNAVLFQHYVQNARAELALLYYQTGDSVKSKAVLDSLEAREERDDVQLLAALAEVHDDPLRADAHFRLAIQLQHALHLKAAHREYQEAYRLSSDPMLKREIQSYLTVKMPKNYLEISPLALYYIKAGDMAETESLTGGTANLDKAAHFYQQAIVAAPNFEWAYYHLGMVNKKLGQSRKAEEYVSKAIKLNPEFFLPYLSLGELALDQEHFTQAIDQYQKALALTKNLAEPEDNTVVANIQNQLGYSYEQVEDYKHASEHYQAAVSLLDKTFEAYLSENVEGADPGDDDYRQAMDYLRERSEDYSYAKESMQRLDSMT